MCIRDSSSNSYNVIESIDFTALADSTDSDILKATDEYLSNATPTRKNNYTGLLKDYNLITICAESFCPWFISEELTPTLYKLSHTGILFENYYGTFQSVTTNGEYTMCMGLYPDMSRTKTDSSFNVAGTNYLPFCLGNALKEKGYQTWGYHDYIGDFYNRNITHANMGYTFKAADSGLAMKIDWPSSDLEMMEASVDDYINSGEPFHAYYMTFSGHYQYNWDNAMSAKNRDAVKDLPYSEPVKAYIACNLELEYALEYLMQRLEEAGVADKTCIVLTNDHYPYGLTEDEYNELAGQTLDTTFEKYRNSFICYVPGLSENIRVRSILGRFLEHSRIYAFCNSDGPQIGEGPAAGPEVWIGSADLMHRNLDRRVEALVRIVAPEQIDELIKYVDLQMADSTASWHMQADGTYVRHCKDEEGRPLVDSQEYLIKKHTRRPVRH